MLELPRIREDKLGLVEALAKRGSDYGQMIDEILSLDQKRRNAQTVRDQLFSEAKSISKRIGQLMSQGKADEAEEVKNKVQGIKERSKALEAEVSELEKGLKEALMSVPNVPNDPVPAGQSEEDNLIYNTGGNMPELKEEALPHWELAAEYGIIDFELGVKITGAGFPVYRGKGAILQRALISYFLDKAREEGYTEYQVPLMVNEASGFGTGQLPDKEGQMYHIQADDFYMIPTAEVPLTNIYRDVLLDGSELPIKMTGYTPCFRREAGSYGKHVRGLNRLHQFDKVEIVQVVEPGNSYKVLEEMRSYITSLVESLELPYRTLLLCGGDLGFASAMTYDLETFSAAQNRWLEVSSVSNFETYQSNRLKLRIRNSDGKNYLAHTLNGSALALPRILATILENNQEERGIRIPEVLRKYTGFDYITNNREA